MKCTFVLPLLRYVNLKAVYPIFRDALLLLFNVRETCAGTRNPPPLHPF